MARPKSPEGKRVTICVKVSEADAAAIDAARGQLTRSAWGRRQMLAAVNSGGPIAAWPASQRREEASRPVSSLPVSPSPARAEAASQRRDEKCHHPKARVLKGQCRVCMEYVGKR